MLALHLVSAFAWVAGVIVFWVLIYTVRKTDSAEETIRMEPIATVGNVAVGVGMFGTIVLGLWLAFSIGGYDVWDGWIIAALVLWVVSAPLGQRTGKAYLQGMNKAEELQADGQTGPNAELL